MTHYGTSRCMKNIKYHFLKKRRLYTRFHFFSTPRNRIQWSIEEICQFQSGNRCIHCIFSSSLQISTLQHNWSRKSQKIKQNYWFFYHGKSSALPVYSSQQVPSFCTIIHQPDQNESGGVLYNIILRHHWRWVMPNFEMTFGSNRGLCA